MELMSSLLLCALAALVPLTLGILPPSEIRMDDLKLIGKTPIGRPVILNPNSPLMATQSKQDIFSKPMCQNCIVCMEMAMTLHPRQHQHASYKTPVEEPYANDILESYHQYKSFREKRELNKYEDRAHLNKNSINKMKKNKDVTVTKYSSGGQVYALKVKEEDLDGNQDSDTACRVYRVKKYYPCDVPDGDLMKLFAKKKGKRTKKVQSIKHQKTSPRSVHSTFVAKPALSDPKGMKTLGDTSQMVENFMTSIEEMY